MSPNRNLPLTVLNVRITAKQQIIYQLSKYVNGAGISHLAEYLWHDLILLADFACLLEPLDICSCFPGEDLLLLCLFIGFWIWRHIYLIYVSWLIVPRIPTLRVLRRNTSNQSLTNEVVKGRRWKEISQSAQQSLSWTACCNFNKCTISFL